MQIVTLRAKHQLHKLTSIAAALAAVAAFGVAQATPSGAAVVRPNAPTNVSAVAGNAQATVSWKAAILGGNPSSFTATATPGGQTCTTANGTTLSCAVTGLTNGTSYTFTVIATNSQGSSSASSPSAAVTPVTIPGAPTSVTATSSDSEATVSWNAPASDGGAVITGYTVTASPGGATCSTSSALSCTVTGLTNGTSYTFTVVAANAVGDSAASAPSSSATPSTLPSAPTNVQLTAGVGQVVVSWSAPTSSGGSPIIGYTVTASPGGKTCSTTSALTCTVMGLTNGQRYSFEVVASNADGASVAAKVFGNEASPGASFNSNGYSLDATSCVSATFCVGGGYYEDSTEAYQAFVSVFNGTAWTDTEVAGTLNAGGNAYVSSVSCTSGTSCVAAGTYTDSNYGYQAFVSVFNGTAWTDTEVAGALNTRGNATMSSVSCNSATSCVAGGSYEDSSGTHAFVSVFNGTTWTTSEVAGTLNYGGNASVNSVSCTSGASCIAVGYFEDSSYHPQAFVSVFNGTTWTSSEVAGTMNAGGRASFTSVSCTSANFCVAGGSYRDVSGSSHSFVAVFNGTTWNTSEVAGTMNAVGYANVFSVSCTSATSCVASGAYADSNHRYQAFVSVFNGTTWTDSEVAGALNVIGAAATSVSCTSATYCVAGGYYADENYTYNAFVSVFNGTAWTDTQVAEEPSVSVQAQSVSCTSVAFCIAAGSSGPHSFVVTPANPSVTLPTSPQAPSGVAATPGDGRAIVAWSAPSRDGGSSIASYTVTASPGGRTCTTSDGSTLTCTVTGLTNGDSYTFTVVATNGVGAGAASDPSFAVIPITHPDAPTNVSGTAGIGQVTVSWTTPNSGGSPITGYTVTASPGGATCATVTGDTTSCIVNGLASGASYTFTVTATNSAGTSVPSSASSVVVTLAVPGVPTSVVATAGDGQATVRWTAPTSDGGTPVTGYSVQALPGGQTCATTGSTSCTITGLRNGVSSTFEVSATNLVGSSDWSAASAPTTFVAPPSPPTSPAVRVDAGQIVVYWSAPYFDGGSQVTSYTATASPGGASCTTSGDLTCSISGLTNGVTYMISIVAANSAGASSPVSTMWTDAEVGGSLNPYSATVNATSCPSATFCVAGGFYRDRTGRQAFVSVFNGTTWSDVELATSLNAKGYASVTSISCPTTTFCIAGGSFEDNRYHQQAFVSEFNGTSWTDTELASSLDARGIAEVTAVSCSSATFCVAGGDYQTPSFDDNAFVSVFNGATWTDADVATALNAGSLAGVNSLSCTSANFCAAGGYYADASSVRQAFVSTYNGTSWADTEVAGELNVGGAAVSSVSCTSAAFCVAGGNYSDIDGGTQAFASAFNGTSWSDVELAGALNTANLGTVNAVSCVSQTFCFAVGSYKNATSQQAFVARFDGAQWLADTVATALNVGRSPAIPSATLSAVSCVTTTMCVAGGSYTDATGHSQAFASTFNGTTWVDAEVAGTLNSGGNAQANGVSCPSSSFCVLGGSYGSHEAFVSLLGSISATLLAAPSAPVGVGASAGDGQAAVTWSAPTSNGGSSITGYTVTASPGGATCSTTGALSCTVTGLADGTSYTFTVTATNVLGTGASSSPSAAVTPSAPVVVAPSVPGTPSLTDNHGSISLTWSAPTSDGGATVTYNVEEQTNHGTWSEVATGLTSPSDTYQGTTAQNTYAFAIVAVNSAGRSAWSTAAWIKAAVGKPSVPGTPVLTDNHGSISLAWSAPTNSGGGAVTYKVEELTNHGSWSEVATGLTSPSYTYQGTTAKTTYSFAVIAANSAGQSAWSTAAYLQAVAVKPSIPGTPSLTDNHGSFTVTWSPSANNGGDVVTYKVEELTNHGSWSEVATSLTSPTFTYQGTTASNTYCFAIVAANSAGQSTWSPSAYLRAS